MKTPSVRSTAHLLVVALVSVLIFQAKEASSIGPTAQDPGVRGGPPGAGAAIDGLSASQVEYFAAGGDEFSLVDAVSDGLGPRQGT